MHDVPGRERVSVLEHDRSAAVRHGIRVPGRYQRERVRRGRVRPRRRAELSELPERDDMPRDRLEDPAGVPGGDVLGGGRDRVRELPGGASGAFYANVFHPSLGFNT